MHVNEKNFKNEKVNAGGEETDVENEFGKKMEEPEAEERLTEDSIAVETDIDIDEIPNPENIDEAGKTLNYLKNALKRLKKECEDSNSNYLKSLADFENFRKRMNREKEESLKFSNERLLKDMLPAIDYLDLAIGHSAYYLGQDSSGNLKSFIDGVKLAYDEFIKILKNHGVEIIETSGKNFDPNFHEAVEILEDSGEPDGKIIAEKRKGYVFKERLLRPAMVSIAKNKN